MDRWTVEEVDGWIENRGSGWTVEEVDGWIENRGSGWMDR